MLYIGFWFTNLIWEISLEMSGFFFTELLLQDCASQILEDSLLYMTGFRGFLLLF